MTKTLKAVAIAAMLAVGLTFGAPRYVAAQGPFSAQIQRAINALRAGTTTFTTPVVTTSLTTPKIYGGTGANGTLQLVSTSGTGDGTGAVKISGGVNGATLIATFNNDGTTLFSGAMQSQSFNTTGSIVGLSFIRAGSADATSPIAGDIVANRGGNPGTGVIFFGGSANAHYLLYDGTNFIFNGNSVIPGTTSQANLAANNPTNGGMIYCTDCTIANPCASGGSGAIAKRLNGVQVCN